MKKLSYYLGKYWYAYVLAIGSLLIYEALDMISPRVTKQIIDDVIVGGETGLLPKLLILLLTVGVGRVVFGYAREYTFDKTSFRIATDMRKRLFGHIQSLSVDYFDKTNTGEIMSRLKDDVDRVQAAFGYVCMLSTQIVVHTSMILYCMFTLSPKLTLFPLIALPVCGAIAIVMEKKLDKVYDDISEENARMNTVAEENLAGVRVVKAFAREKHEITKFLGHNKNYYDLNMKQSLVWIRYNPYFQMVTKLLPVASIMWGGVLVINGEMTLGSLGAFIEYCSNAIWPMEMLGWMANEIASAVASKKKLDKIAEEVPSIKDPAEPIRDVDRIRGDVRFDNVSLKLGEKDILKDVSFTVKAGHSLGIMGATGAGKTSIINMLLRFYDADCGSVSLDGYDIKQLPLDTVRAATATVMQDVFLFSDTIDENVRLGRHDEITAEDIRQALTDSCAEEFVKDLADKEETLIGERGVGLSGGQKQRLSMARAFAKKAPILVLDDSTSALDMETEREVQKNLKTLGEMTRIVIAHRISSVRNADEIIVLDEGRIAERGTHDELMAQKGYYYKTYCAQYGGYPEAM